MTLPHYERTEEPTVLLVMVRPALPWVYTNMPHNLGEVIDGVIMLIDNPDAILGFDERQRAGLPTAGLIMAGRAFERLTYRRGSIKYARVSIEPIAGGKHSIIVTEIPYQVNKARLIEKIAELVKEKKLEGISDLRDESDRSGMSIYIELKRDANPQVVLNQLYKHTQLQDTFGVIMLALVDGEPRVLNLKQMLFYYLEHQKDVIVRRTRYELNKAEARAHIVEGLRIALTYLDEVIKTIRASQTTDIAKKALIEKFTLSEKQAEAI